MIIEMNDYNIDVIRSKYSLVPRSLIFIQKENKFLLIHKRKKDSFGFGKLNGVGGHIEKAEEPFESARREICEETGLEVCNLELAAVLFIDIGKNPGIEVFVFIARYESGELINSDEGELVWMSREEIQNSNEILDDIPQLISICIDHEFGRKPKFLKYTHDNKGELRIVIASD